MSEVAEAPAEPLATISRKTPFAATSFLNKLSALDDSQTDDSTNDPIEEPATEPTVEPEAATATSTEPEAVDLSDLIDEATHKGLSKEQAEALGDELPNFLAIMDKQAAAILRGQLKAEPEQEPARQAAPEKQTEPVLPLGKLEAFEPVALDPEVHDEGTIKAFGKQSEHINKQADHINKLQELVGALAQIALGTHGEVEQFKNQTQAQTSTTEQREWDEVFATLPEQYGDAFGKGPITNFSNESPQAKERQAVYQEAKLLEAVDAKAGRPPQDAKEYARRALAYLKSEKVAEAARSDINKKIQTRRKQAIAAPSGRNGKTGSPDDRAKAVIAESLERMGIKSF